MRIKEKELESLILNLLDTSSALQRKIHSICSLSHDSDIVFNHDTKTELSDKRRISSLETKIEQLEKQLDKCQSDYRTISAEKSSLEDKLKLMKTKSDEAERKLRDYESENAQLNESEQALSAELAKANESISILKEHFFNPVNLLKRYKSLSAPIRTGLSDVVCDANEIFFIASCSAPEHLKAIWTYTKRLAGSNGDIAEIEVLKDIFDYFFDVFNNSLSKPMYVRDNVEIGYLFDDDKYNSFLIRFSMI